MYWTNVISGTKRIIPLFYEENAYFFSIKMWKDSVSYQWDFKKTHKLLFKNELQKHLEIIGLFEMNCDTDLRGF